MAVGMVLQFADLDAAKYDLIRKELGLDGPGAVWPKGMITHMAGALPNGGWCVIEQWESPAELDTFRQTRMVPLFQKLGSGSPPTVMMMQVHNSYRRP